MMNPFNECQKECSINSPYVKFFSALACQQRRPDSADNRGSWTLFSVALSLSEAGFQTPFVRHMAIEQLNSLQEVKAGRVLKKKTFNNTKKCI